MTAFPMFWWRRWPRDWPFVSPAIVGIADLSVMERLVSLCPGKSPQLACAAQGAAEDPALRKRIGKGPPGRSLRPF